MYDNTNERIDAMQEALRRMIRELEKLRKKGA